MVEMRFRAVDVGEEVSVFYNSVVRDRGDIVRAGIVSCRRYFIVVVYGIEHILPCLFDGEGKPYFVVKHKVFHRFNGVTAFSKL